jgi:hypothetical protein
VRARTLDRLFQTTVPSATGGDVCSLAAWRLALLISASIASGAAWIRGDGCRGDPPVSLSLMTEHDAKTAAERSPDGDEVKPKLEDAAEAARRPHDDAEEREERREGAERAERSPRRQGEGIHPGTH